MEKLTLSSRINAINYSFSGTMGVYANDFKGNTIELNADEHFETASCIKVPILATLLRRVHEKQIHLDDKISYTPENYVDGSGILRALSVGLELSILDFATLMIIVSDNIATNTLIELLGIDAINETCEILGLKETRLHNKIDFEAYRQLGTTTPREYAVIFELAYKKKLWSAEMSDLFVAILKKQHYNTMLTKDLTPYYFDSEDTGDEELLSIASKSGSMNACRNDGGLFYTPYGGYVITILTKDFRDPLYYSEHESYQFGPKVSRLILDHYLSLKGSF
ncbi:serine hydrolase [Fusibacter ferrireducens]|uniref:Serine hydrolase n=1 Tax=Fusibacter ferrireducens TaxID=2785058 RepID=A0ABR9ZS34_9FIRM|nr:serine hydrolase [Fusibacter ferrireducens]MBF4693268.1 serine hydrolase [Fusibacter ferrireducens]